MSASLDAQAGPLDGFVLAPRGGWRRSFIHGKTDSMRASLIDGEDPHFIHDIYQARKARGLSIRALAATAGIGYSAWARCERGEGAPSPHTRCKLQAWLDGREGLNCLCPKCTGRMPMGWQCPLCHCVYAPTVLECAKCGEKENPFLDV